MAALLDLSVDHVANMLLEKAIDNSSAAMLTQAKRNYSDGDRDSQPVEKIKLADRIRSHVMKNLIVPARRDGKIDIVVRAGDVHRELGLRNRLPAVCAALGANVFLKLASVELTSASGPSNGATTEFTFKL